MHNPLGLCASFFVCDYLLTKNKKGMKTKLFTMMFALVSIMWGFNASAEVVEYTCGATESDNVIASLDTETGMMTVSGIGAMKMFDSSAVPWNDSKSYIVTVVVEEGVTCVGKYSFWASENLISVTLPSTLTEIGDFAFYKCSGLKTIEIPDAVTEIGEAAFGNCSLLESVKLPLNMTIIGNRLFESCSSLKTVDIPEGVTKIHSDAFRNAGLTSIEIPASVTEITGITFLGENEGAYSSCPSLETITVAPENTVYDSRDNCNAIIKTANNELFAGCKNTVIPNSVEKIGKNAFKKISLKRLTIPSSVTTIGDYAFENCYDLEYIDIPKSVTTIGMYAFNHTHVKTTPEVELRRPIYVNKIPMVGFKDKNISSVILGSSVEIVGSCAFQSCENLTTVVSLATVAPKLYTDAFLYINTDCVLYYPAGSDYSSWEGYFSSMVELPLSGKCGDNLTWAFDTETYTLRITGEGAMYEYTTDNPAPWQLFSRAIEMLILSPDQTNIYTGNFADCLNLKLVIYENENTNLKLEVNGNNLSQYIDEDAKLFYSRLSPAQYLARSIGLGNVDQIQLYLNGKGANTTLEMNCNETHALSYEYTLEGYLTGVEYEWDSSDASIVSVSDTGVLTSGSEGGKADITLSVVTPSGRTLSLTCTVTVKDTATGIDEVISSEDSGDGSVYDMLGRRVENPERGIYIKNGKKIVIK